MFEIPAWLVGSALFADGVGVVLYFSVARMYTILLAAVPRFLLAALYVYLVIVPGGIAIEVRAQLVRAALMMWCLAELLHFGLYLWMRKNGESAGHVR